MSEPTLWDQEAEAGLGAALVNADAAAAVAALSEGDLSRDTDRVILRAIRHLQPGTVDVTTVAARLEDTGELELAGGRDRIALLAANCPAPGKASDYVALILKKSDLRDGRNVAAALHAGEIDAREARDRLDAIERRRTRGRPWPAAMAPEAFHGPAGELVREIEPSSEADPAALLVHFLVAFGNACGRGPHWGQSSGRHGSNLYCFVIGGTSQGRKGTAHGEIRSFMTRIYPDWPGRERSGLSSGEGLLYHVRDARYERREPTNDAESARAEPDGLVKVLTDEGVADKRLMVVQSEAAQFLKAMKGDRNTLSSAIRDLWDKGSGGTLTRNNSVTATEAHVSVIAHCTPEEFRQLLDQVEVLNGFANRFLFVCSRRSKVLAFPRPPTESALERLAAVVRGATEFAVTAGEMEMSYPARELWRSIYERLSESSDDVLGAVTNRGYVQVLRLAVIYALLDHSATIEVSHLRAAGAVWRYCFDSARFVFTDQRETRDAAPGDAPGPVTQALRELLRLEPTWKGTSRQLLDRLATLAGSSTSSKEWPKDPARLSGTLTALEPSLAREGISVSRGRTAGQRTIELRSSVIASSASSDTPNSASASHLRDDADGDAVVTLEGAASSAVTLEGAQSDADRDTASSRKPHGNGESEPDDADDADDAALPPRAAA
jgi:hypothetical protein